MINSEVNAIDAGCRIGKMSIFRLQPLTMVTYRMDPLVFSEFVLILKTFEARITSEHACILWKKGTVEESQGLEVVETSNRKYMIAEFEGSLETAGWITLWMSSTCKFRPFFDA